MEGRGGEEGEGKGMEGREGRDPCVYLQIYLRLTYPSMR